MKIRVGICSILLSLIAGSYFIVSGNISENCSDRFFEFFILQKIIHAKHINGDEFDNFPSYKKVSLYNNKIGFLVFDNQRLYFSLLDLEKNKLLRKDYIPLDVEGLTKRYDVIAFGFNDENLIITIGEKVFIFNFNSKRIIFKTQLDKYIRFIKVFKDKAFLWDFGYKKTRSEVQCNTYFYELNLKNYEFRYFNLGTPKGFYFTLFYPPEVIDFSNDFIVYSDIVSYRIKVYDKNKDFIYEIIKTDSLFKELIEEKHLKFSDLVKNYSTTVKSALDSMRQTFFSGVGIIEKINFINDSTLLVRWYGPKTDTNRWYPDIYYDIWLIKNDTSYLIGKNIKAEFPNDSIFIACYPLYSSRYECGFNYIVNFFKSYCYEEGSLAESLRMYYERQKQCYGNIPFPRLSIYEFKK